MFKRLFIGTHGIDVYRYNQVLFCLNSITQMAKAPILADANDPLFTRRELAERWRHLGEPALAHLRALSIQYPNADATLAAIANLRAALTCLKARST